MANPTFGTIGTLLANNTGGTPGMATHVANDILVLAVESASEDPITLSAAQGFVEGPDSPIATVATGTNGTRLTWFWKRALSDTDLAPTLNAPGGTADHLAAVIFTIVGCETSGNPFDVTAQSKEETNTTTISCPGDTTTVAECLIVHVIAHRKDTASDIFNSAFTNTDLASITKRSGALSTSVGHGGGLGIVSAQKATASAFGATAGTLTLVAQQARLTIAFKPPAVGGGGGTALSAHRYWRILQTNLPGAGPEVNEIVLGTPPLWVNIPDVTINEGDLLEITAVAVDSTTPEINLTYAVVGSLPVGAVFVPSTRTFTWTPDFTQSGSYLVTLRVTNTGGASSDESFTITVNDVALVTASNLLQNLRYDADAQAGRFYLTVSWNSRNQALASSLRQGITGIVVEMADLSRLE